jgi:hypothetical protein
LFFIYINHSDSSEQFGIRYHDFQFLEAKVHYPDSDPQMELVFSRDRERATTTRRLNDENTIQILGVGLAYLDEDRVPMVGVSFRFYHWTFEKDVPLGCLKGRPGFSPSEILS